MKYLILLISSFLILSCSSPEKPEVIVQSKNGLTLTPVTDSPTYPDAKLSYGTNAVTVDGNTVNFDFRVLGYELGAQTDDAATKGLANSVDGQHIHLILNNGPYSAHYEPTFSKELEDGTYTLLAFLSRSYHESVKTRSAFVIDQFVVGESEATLIDFSKPHMFYSRPKGSYSGKDIENLLLDFYLINTRISEEGNYVDATINGTTFKITDWKPYIIQGLQAGEVTIKLELKDKDGALINSPYNPVERKVMLSE